MSWINGESVGIVLFFVGLFGLVARRNMLKSIISLAIMQVAAILFFLSGSVALGQEPPIGEHEDISFVADPLPQALMITDIVIGIGVTAVALTLMIHLYHRYGTSNWLRAMKKRIE
ncbi:MAG: cation:proton antiporter subunit C [Clostridiales bacterium]|nr:cation:proton antiporter subunit C [Clostridiales bacterium]